jgi:hypothetical protein
MPFEMFLILLKGFCEASNWKTVPFTVVSKWAMRRRFLQKESDCDILDVDTDDIDVVASSAFLFGPTLQTALSASKLVSHAVSHTQDHNQIVQARYLTYFRREQVELQARDWVLLVSKGEKYVARVSEMAQFVFPGGSQRVRLYCTDCRSLKDSTEDEDSMIRLAKASPCTAMFVRIEDVSITQLLLTTCESTLQFRYVL